MKASISTHPVSTSQGRLALLLSLLFPGAGQFYLGQRSRGVTLLVTTAVLGFLIEWSELPALLAGLGLLWLWNLADVYQWARGRALSVAPAVFLALLLVYAIGWKEIGVDLNKVFTRFGDMQPVLLDLVHPDVLTRAQQEQSDIVDIQVPCGPNPPAPAAVKPGQPTLVLSQTCRAVGAPLTLHGVNFPPGEHGSLIWVDPIGNEFQLRDPKTKQFIDLAPDANGQFTVTIPVPDVVPAGQSRSNPLIHQVEARFAKPVGAPYPSDMFVLITQKMVETIAVALMATILSILVAIPISFFGARNVVGRNQAGTVVYYVVRLFFNVVRSVDPLVWGLVVVVWVGLGPFAGVLALTIHSIAALGKLYSEEVEHIDPGPVEAVTATGANLLQTIRYAVAPQVIPPFLGYTLLRWDINVRSATIVGFVAGGGIGFLLIQFIQKGAYNQYATAMWSIAIVVYVLDYLSARWRERILQTETRVAQATRGFLGSWRTIALTLLVVVVFVASWNISQIDLGEFLRPGKNFGSLVHDFVTVDLGADTISVTGNLMLQTILMALLATTVGGALAIPFSFLAARNLTGRSRLLVWLYYLVRTVFNLFRSVEPLIYVTLFIIWVGIGPFAGMIALSFATFALLGKLFSEAIENVDTGPVEAITTTGANRLQTIAFAIIPQIVPPFISYAIYQWDINIRISTIIGFGGGGGIGFQLQTWMNMLQYHKAGTAVLAIVLVVTAMDYASAKIRERLV
jgi:phosphonate transport system permease protein